jgi:UDP-N-acetylmuramoylalanine--D-glutamate ligase
VEPKMEPTSEKKANALQGKRVLVVGLKKSGVAVVRFCLSRNARVSISDLASADALKLELESLRDGDVDYELGEHRLKTFLGADLIVVSPGVPLSIEPIREAQKKNIDVISEVELASRFLKGRIVAITGSNGKTTSTTLAGKVFGESGFPVQVGGNIGTPLISLVDSSTEETVTVAEISSFQLEAIPTFRPNVGVILNVTPDHLDRYASFEEYASFKRALFKNQRKEDWAVLNADDPVSARFAHGLSSRMWWFSQKKALAEGCFFADGRIQVAHAGETITVMARNEIPMLGAHNVENCLAVVSAAAILGADYKNVARAIAGFEGVEHRLEFVADIQGVKYYNDSKATNVDATTKALESFPGNVILILGGKDKGSDYTILSSLLRDRVKQVLLIGAAAEKIHKQLVGVIPLKQCGNLETAVAMTPSVSVPGDIVLLAPACASFDQFSNYEHRGQVFKQLVRSLKSS